MLGELLVNWCDAIEIVDYIHRRANLSRGLRAMDLASEAIAHVTHAPQRICWRPTFETRGQVVKEQTEETIFAWALACILN